MESCRVGSSRLNPRPLSQAWVPRERNWRDEFPNAVASGINYIEWIVDAYGLNANPIFTEAGLAEVDALKTRFGIQTLSLCSDWFMTNTLLRCTQPNASNVSSSFTV